MREKKLVAVDWTDHEFAGVLRQWSKGKDWTWRHVGRGTHYHVPGEEGTFALVLFDRNNERTIFVREDVVGSVGPREEGKR